MPLHALVQLGEETLGHDETQRNRVATYLRMTILGGQRGRQHFHRRLRRGVGRLRSVTAEPLARPHADDRATAASDMACRQGSSAQRRLVAMVSSEAARSGSRIARWRGIRCMSLALFTSRSTTEVPLPRLEQRCHRLRVGDAHGRGQPRGPLRPRSARCRRWPLSHQCRPPPLCRPRPRWRGRCLADPGASAGHHGRLAFKPCHRVLLDCVVLSRHAARPQPEKAQGQRSRARHRQRRFR